LREIVRLGLPQGWSGVLIYAVPALMLCRWRHRWRPIRAGGLPLLMVAWVGGLHALFAVALTLVSRHDRDPVYLSPVWATLLERFRARHADGAPPNSRLALGLAGMATLRASTGLAVSGESSPNDGAGGRCLLGVGLSRQRRATRARSRQTCVQFFSAAPSDSARPGARQAMRRRRAFGAIVGALPGSW